MYVLCYVLLYVFLPLWVSPRTGWSSAGGSRSSHPPPAHHCSEHTHKQGKVNSPKK